MAVLNINLQNKIDKVEDLAYEKFIEGKIEESLKLREEAWELYPTPASNWNEAYNSAKYAFVQCLKIENLNFTQKWLNRMIECNNSLHLFDSELQFYIGIYDFETKNYDQAYANWKSVVEEAGYRYFENTKPEYLDFYRNPEKHTKND